MPRNKVGYAIVSATLALSIALAGNPAQAQGTNSATFDYFIMNQPLSGFLSDLVEDAKLRMQIEDGIQGRLRTKRLQGTPDEILDDLAADGEIDWFKYNTVYYVSRKSQAITRIIRLGDLSVNVLKRTLEEAGLDVKAYPLLPNYENSAATLTGPPKFIAIVEGLVNSIPEASPEVPDVQYSATVRVRRAGILSIEPVPTFER